MTAAGTESPSRLAWRVTEPLHALVYLVPEASEIYAAAGLDPMAGYFAARGAAFGRTGPALVSATFYNFNPALVARALPAAWDLVTPERMIDVRLEIADAALTRALGAENLATREITEAAELAETAARHAATVPHGRPLFAAHTELPWPDAPHLRLFHAQTLLREFRGDGHIATLVEAGISGLEAIILHVATGAIDGRFLRVTRGWRREQWATATEGLRERGLMTGDELSEEGRRLRESLEAATDRLAEPAYRVLGDEGCLRLAELTRPLSRIVVKAGMLNPAGLTDAASERKHPG
ncbi:SCO6745 family protein [Actinoplanes sp. HUAS TT8]|uniref:SCO6745 family protein n=1 Tax=Actinoplanes sp. HUAS TT8 TaxID=3447453 RepID=UPI003F523638